jgi:hypothetical protein
LLGNDRPRTELSSPLASTPGRAGNNRAPHLSQKMLLGEFSVPQSGHRPLVVGPSLCPHELQNLLPSLFTVPQFGQGAAIAYGSRSLCGRSNPISTLKPVAMVPRATPSSIPRAPAMAKTWTSQSRASASVRPS